MSSGFLGEFLSSSDWQRMRDTLEGTAGASVLWMVSASGRSVQKFDDRYPELCQLIRGSSEGLRRCRNSHRTLFREVKRTGQPVVSECYCGLVVFALPLILDEEIISIAGGCHQRAASPITMEKCAELSTACDIDLKAIMDRARKIKHMPKVEQKRLLSMLAMFTDALSLLIKWMSRLLITMDLEDQYAARLSSLVEIVRVATAETDREEMLRTVATRTKEALKVDACSIYLLDQHHQELVLTATDGLPAAFLGRRIKVGEGITGHVARTQTIVAVQDATADPRFGSFLSSSKTERKRWIYKSVLSVPLVARDRLVGVMDARTSTPKRWLQTDADFLSIIAGQVAAAIERDEGRRSPQEQL